MAVSFWTRRKFMAATASVLPLMGQDAADSRLTARPGSSRMKLDPGLIALGLRPHRDAALYVPESAAQRKDPALVVSLHGAGRDAARGIELLQAAADRHGFLVLAPASAARTWDRVDGRWGPDVRFVDQALRWVYERVPLDRSRVALSGFSDGASYALSLGLRNGDCFGSLIGFSPGFISEDSRQGLPRVFVSHGNQDNVFPISVCGRKIARQLEAEGYPVSFREFDGGHDIPEPITEDAASWFLA